MLTQSPLAEYLTSLKPKLKVESMKRNELLSSIDSAACFTPSLMILMVPGQ